MRWELAEYIEVCKPCQAEEGKQTDQRHTYVPTDILEGSDPDVCDVPQQLGVEDGDEGAVIAHTVTQGPPVM